MPKVGRNRLGGWSTRLAVALLALGVVLNLVGSRPVEYHSFEVPVFNTMLEGAEPAVEIRTARGAWSESVPSGEDVSVYLTLDGVVGSPESADSGLLALNAVYSSTNPQIEARLEIRDVSVYPPGSILQPMVLGRPVRLFWRINAPRAGDYEGTLWVYLNYASPDGTPNHQLVLARPVTVRAVDVLGFRPYQVRTAGRAALGLALVAALPLGWWIMVRLWSRVRRERGTEG